MSLSKEIKKLREYAEKLRNAKKIDADVFELIQTVDDVSYDIDSVVDSIESKTIKEDVNVHIHIPEIKRLREALEPFAEIFKQVEIGENHSYSDGYASTNYSHFRKAYNVFNKGES